MLEMESVSSTEAVLHNAHSFTFTDMRLTGNGKLGQSLALKLDRHGSVGINVGEEGFCGRTNVLCRGGECEGEGEGED